MPEVDDSLPNAENELVDAPQAAIDMEALAEKIMALLRKEIEIESERFGKLLSGR